ncbi:MAG: GAF domain-containing sensor histidine kinase [Anaerolineae bacterium]
MPTRPQPESDTEKLQRRNRELSILNSIAEALSREVDLDRALRTALEQVAELFDLHTGWIWLMDGDKPYLAIAQNLPPALTHHPELMDGEVYCHCLDTYKRGDLSGAANVNIVTCTRLKGLIGDTDGLRYHASIPLYAHGKKLGMLNVVSKEWDKLSAEDLKLLYTVGDLLSIAIERARLFSQSIQFGASEERNRLAREIHDTLAQGLTAIALQLEAADALLESGEQIERARQMVQQALVLTRSNLEEARRSVQDLRAVPLEGRHLADALQTLCDEYAKRWSLDIRFVSIGRRDLPLRVEAGLYRVAQEALTNAAHHAEAKRITVTLEIEPEEVCLMVVDDGRGFDPTQVSEGRFGLIGLNERVKLLGGNTSN